MIEKQNAKDLSSLGVFCGSPGQESVVVQPMQDVGLPDHRLKVLVIDDSKTTHTMLRSVISDSPAHELVGVAHDARDVMALVNSTAPDMIVIDLCMPYIGGSELLSMLRNFPCVHKVILSARASASGPIRQRLTELGATAFFDRSEVAANPHAFQDELRRIGNVKIASRKPKPPAAEPPPASQSGTNVIFAADRFPIPRDEQARVRTLEAMNIANLSFDPSLDIIVRHIAKMIDYPFVAVNLIDAEKVWAKAAVGFERQAFPRNESFCAHAICHEGPLMIADASTHPVFRTLPMVTNDLQVRAYVGAPIVSKDGVTLGVVCAGHSRRRNASQADVSRLVDAAKLIAAFLEDPARQQAA